jgi:DNA polymerase-3 subunit epsilon/CBS domain-containing protein
MAEAQMAERGRGGPPVPYVLLVLGSAGRGETLLAPDQDNAILFESGEADGPEDLWFAELGIILADILNDIGVPYCDGGVMAKNTEWRHSFDDWVAEMKGWIGHAEWKDLLDVIVFFDFRPVYGDERLARKLWHRANRLANRSPGFLKQLAAAATDLRAPLGLFGNIKTEEGRVDLKMGGLLALVSGARILALRHGIEKRPTRDRLEGVKDAGIANADDLNDVMEAHAILLKEIVGQQLSDIATGVPPSNKVVLKSLSKSRREQLRWALGKVEVMNTLVGDPMAFG